MGGYGSGRWGWHSKKTTVEESLSLSASTLRETFRRGVPWWGAVRWSWGGKDTCSIGYRFYPEGDGGRLQLVYTTTRPGGEKIESDYPVHLVTTPCQFGGRRWWFVCPLVKSGKPCGRRCATLYSPPGAVYFGCRECYELTYTSCQESHKFDAMFAALAADTGYTPEQVRRALTRRWL